MVILVGHWDFSWSTPSEEVNYWEGVIREFAIDRFIMTPVTGFRKRWIEEIDSLEDFINEFKGEVIFVTEVGETELSDFIHPEGDVMYIFGKSTYSPWHNLKRPQDKSVVIKTIANTGMMLAPVAASIILHDRIKQ